MKQHNAVKIVATVGPASRAPAMLQQLIRAGVNVFRLNFSHGTPADHAENAQAIREAAKECQKEVALLVDLQGPKIRVAKFVDGKTLLENGQTFILDANFHELGDNKKVGLDYPDLPKDVQPGDTLLLNDGLISLQVTKILGSSVYTVVIDGGELSNNKGINKKGGGLSAPALTNKDISDLKSALLFQPEFIAISFVKNAQDIELARRICQESIPFDASSSYFPSIIAKIERVEAIPRLVEIIKASEGIMVARGDLAVEVGNAAVPALQKKMIALAREHNKAAITATQMMESMIYNPQPTRAEVSDVANAVLDGTDAVMLSAESATGKFPLQTIQEMYTICKSAEESSFQELETNFKGKFFTRSDQGIAIGALFTAFHLQAKAIVALTESGTTAIWMSRHNVGIPIYALTRRQETQRKLSLYRNVHSLLLPIETERDKALANAEEYLKRAGILEVGDIYAITCGEPMGYPGGTNMLKICRVT